MLRIFIKNGGFWRLGGTLGALWAHPGTGGGFLTIFGRLFGDIWSPLAALGPPRGPTLGIFRPLGHHFVAPGRHWRHHAVRTLFLASPGDEKVRFLGGPDVAYI